MANLDSYLDPKPEPKPESPNDQPANPPPRSEAEQQDIQLLQRIAQQDQAALSQLYDRYARIIYAVAYRSLGSVEESEEVVLDVFAQVWRSAANYDPKRSRVDTWIFMMQRSRTLDRLRSLQRRTKVTQATMAVTSQESFTGLDPRDDLIISERRARVLQALDKLPTEQRQVIELAYYQGLSQSEIATQTGLALGTVKTRIRLGLNKLRSALGDWDG